MKLLHLLTSQAIFLVFSMASQASTPVAVSEQAAPGSLAPNSTSPASNSTSPVPKVEIPRTAVFELTDPVSKRVYPLWVKLPRSYQSDSERHYPVIYVVDAPYAFQIVSGMTRFPMNSGKMREAIIVGLSYAKGDKGPQSRVRDYTQVVDSGWKLETGGASQYADYLQTVVLPFVAGRYRVNDNELTFVGNSLGGLLGANLLLEKPNLFDNYVLGSPSVWFNGEQILSLMAKPRAEEKQARRVFLAVGALETPAKAGMQHDMVAGADKLGRHLRRQLGDNLVLESLIIAGARHETAFPTTASQGLYWLLASDGEGSTQ
ncbi:alpha/beta hydrolase-fold protein [Shewanella sp. Isolate8]|uniref:alpha/beta hydrolase n=1 Tax=Shewanella sp. Isolate8 TaxID=2908529 RepID=UPI001EFEC10D|nr:alpha/beta hydrolase-fold protein [Shewanella sp. Isolate8]MCG9747261.1 alpha/beta hydrolase [Shewanella sp. Isolate8]